jgi:hypothetical protein
MAGGICILGSVEEREVVEMLRVIAVAPLPAAIVADGKKVAFALVGRPVAANVMKLEYVPFVGATVRLKGTGWPAFTVPEVVRVFMV